MWCDPKVIAVFRHVTTPVGYRMVVERRAGGIARRGSVAVAPIPAEARVTVDRGSRRLTPFSTGRVFGVHSRESDGGAA